MKMNVAQETAHEATRKMLSPAYRADPLRQRYLRLWIRLHLAQEYESCLKPDPACTLSATERARLIGRTLFSVWQQAQEMDLRLPRLGGRAEMPPRSST